MPTQMAERREDEVIDLVTADLKRHSGQLATVLDRPDRNRHRADGLTVDASSRQCSVGLGRDDAALAA